jgi:hypothetical protein
VRPRLPGREHRALGVLYDRHAAEAHNVEGVTVDRAAQLAGAGRGFVGALDAHVGEPVGRDPLLTALGPHLVEAADPVAVEAQHRVGSRLPRGRILRLPAKEPAVEGFGACRIRRHQVHPAEGSRLVTLPLAHASCSLPALPTAELPYKNPTRSPPVPK